MSEIDMERWQHKANLGAEIVRLKEDVELHQDVIEGIRRNVLEAIEVLNNGEWGHDGSQERRDAIKCRSILRRIVPHDCTSGKDLPTDLLKMQERAGQP